MKNKGFKAVLSALMLAAAMPFTALHASAAEQNGDILPYETYEGIAEDKCNVIAAQMYAAPGETISYPVYMYHNTGYSYAGIGVIFDGRLIPVLNQYGKVDSSAGSACDDLHPVFSSRTKDGHYKFGMATMPQNEDNPEDSDDGVLWYAKLKIPEDAVAGDRYPMQLQVVELEDADEKELPYNTIDGWIEVRGETVGTLENDFKQHPVASAGVIALIAGSLIASAASIVKRQKSK